MSSTERRSLRMAVVVAVMGLTTAACGGGDDQAQGEDLSDLEFPDYYPSDYQDLIEASQDEGGELVLYQNVDQENLAPLLRDFQARYPWVETISAQNLDSDVIFQRHLSDVATGGTSADMLLTNSVQGWAQYLQTDNAILEYESPEANELPDFADLSAGVYAMSFDPVGIGYNASLFPGEPTSLAEMADIVAEDPEAFDGKISARDVENSYGFTASHGLVEGNPDVWESLEVLLPLSRPETSSGTQNEKMLQGEYVASIVLSSAPAFNLSVDPATSELFEYVLPTDGTVVLGRGIGITPDAPHPATAKLFLDFLLSEVGQDAVAEGGLAAYRESVEPGEDQLTYGTIIEAIGEENVIQVPYEVVTPEEQQEFVDRWNSLTS